MSQKLRKKYFATATIFGLTPLFNLLILAGPPPVHASECPDVELIFARGSGAAQYSDRNYSALKSALESKLESTGLKYRSEDLSYPATAVGLSNFKNMLVSLGALVSGGESYDFGRSVAQGVSNMVSEVNSNSCPNTKYVLAGYSQGAIVVDKALQRINSDRVLFAATFGDPKLYLPEGKGVMPAACRGQNLSDYRMYVPECHAYQGLLGGYIPYRPESMVGKVGTWCNAHDIMCSSRFNIENHSSYVSSGLYEDASRVMYAKITDHFGSNREVITPHDTMILLDTTKSMSGMLNAYRKEAVRLAEETLSSGGRVALYSYRDLRDRYNPVEHCNFDTCTLEEFKAKMGQISVAGGGDAKESLLSASLFAMQSLKWRYGATKSLVVLTDAGFHNPDIDKTTLADVVAVSKAIDPVNFYIITKEKEAATYAELAQQTGGKVVTEMNELSLLTDYIMDRYDSLPRVEESSEPLVLPTLAIEQVEKLDDQSVRVRYASDAPKAMVFLNDAFLGVTDQTEFVLSDLQPEYENVLTLVPLTDSLRGDPVLANLNSGMRFEDLYPATQNSAPAAINLPKAPNTGKR